MDTGEPTISEARGDSDGRTSVLLVDDHPVVREGIARVLEDEGRISADRQASDGSEAIEEIEAQGPPDVVLMDISMPRMDGVEATREIRRRWPETVVIGLSVHENGPTAEAMRNAGAADFVPKSVGAQRLVDAIMRLAR